MSIATCVDGWGTSGLVMPQRRSTTWRILSSFASGMSSGGDAVFEDTGGANLPANIFTASLTCTRTMPSSGFSLCVIYLQERRMRENLTYGATRVQKAIE